MPTFFEACGPKRPKTVARRIQWPLSSHVPTEHLAGEMSYRFCDWCRVYDNRAGVNEHVFATFTALTDSIPWLKAHRDWVEQHRFGYGQRAFHYLWYLMLDDLRATFSPIRMLEIGVYKGQTISLCARAARELGAEIEITAVSPFAGNLAPLAAWRACASFVCRPAWRTQYLLGNLHPVSDYFADNRRIFERFGVDFGKVRVVVGLSESPGVVASLARERFSVVFIDGDHSYEAARFDIDTYTALVQEGGLAVIDDAGCFLPGRGYFKGMKSVSRACRALDASPHFRNVLNVGHNRVFRRVS
jgi:hypothetical protein